MNHNLYISYNQTGKVYADCIYSQLINSFQIRNSGKIRPFYFAADNTRPRSARAKEVIPSAYFFIAILTEDYFEIGSVDGEIIKEEISFASQSESVRLVCICTTAAQSINEYLSNKSFFGDLFPKSVNDFLLNPEIFINYGKKEYFNLDLHNAIDYLIGGIPDNLEFGGHVGLGERLVEEDMSEFDSAGRKKNRQMDLPGEAERLAQQQRLLLDFDKEAYEKVFACAPKTILDIGCNSGEALFNRIEACGYQEKYDKIVGIDICRGVIKRAKRNYGSKKVIFETLDVEDANFVKKIRKIMQTNQIENFDFVNISSVLLQLNNPGKLLQQVSGLLSQRSSILIVDVDDGLFMAYPDTYGWFAKTMSICNRCERTGYRQMGRQIYMLLRDKTDCKTISFLKSGLNTSGMNQQQKAAVFDVVFDYIERCVQLECAHKNHSQHLVLADVEWLRNNREKMRKEYDRPDFFFSYGYVIYLAQKTI